MINFPLYEKKLQLSVIACTEEQLLLVHGLVSSANNISLFKKRPVLLRPSMTTPLSIQGIKDY